MGTGTYMLIRFANHANRPATLNCLREDGTPDVRAYSVEAIDTERLVGLIQTVSSQGVPPSYEALCEAWSSSTNGDSSERPPIDEAQLATICAVWQNLTQRWKATEVNHTLELAF